MSDSDAAPADLIRQRAYELWVQDGRPEGRDVEYWLRAESALSQDAATGLETPSAGGTGLGEPMPDNFDVSAVESDRGGVSSDRVGADRQEYVTQRRTRKKADA
jgi:hypothetical protein